MTLAVASAQVDRCLDAIYDAPLVEDGWTGALSELIALFGAGFADVCAWTPDRAHVGGTCVGLDPADYDDQLLGFWFNRNVWGQKRPVRVAGEVISTRQIVPREDLRRSEMYHEYLEARGLHEGLRLSLWVDPDSLADISLLRPWSLGAFGPAEVALGRTLLPHLQRAAALTRRLCGTKLRLVYDGGGAPSAHVAAIAFDRDGLPIWFNRRAEAVLARGDDLRIGNRGLIAASAAATQRLATAVARASGRAGTLRTASSVRLPWAAGSSATTLAVQPLSPRRDWSMPRAPAALALFRDPAEAALRAPVLQAMFSLTAAEAQIALQLAAGQTLQDIAAQTGRSWNTLRKHLANVRTKTGTTRQVDLVRLLNDLEWVGTTELNGAAQNDPDLDRDPRPSPARSFRVM